jgi:radical SAM superfamily enzyme YgiQ (UPF0313 family)
VKILLVNPNRYQRPPVPPLGLEYIAGDLESSGHEVHIIDLCFSDDPLRDLDNSISAFRPDLAGVTVRNIDTVLFQSNEFFLDKIKTLVQHIRNYHSMKVIIGGPGIAVNPEAICDYLGADFAVAGPGEGVLNEVIHGSLLLSNKKILTRQYSYEISCQRRSVGIDYKKYVEHGGIAGFETHKGCSSSCVYCIEAGTKVSFRKIPEVISEIKGFVSSGFKMFHLCDSEFNEDLDYSLEFLRFLKNSGLGIGWTLYMKPSNYSRKLFQLMKETGVSLITLTVDSWKKCPLYWTDIEKIIFSARSHGIRIVLDFLTGFPYEDEDAMKLYLDLFRRLQPDSVGINTYIRLYKPLLVTAVILGDKSLQTRITGNMEDRTFIRPVFYNHIISERLLELLAGDPLFRIEGQDAEVNYTRSRERIMPES